MAHVRGKGRRFHKPIDRASEWARWEWDLRAHLDGNEPCRRLWAAVLEDALYTIYRSRNRAEIAAAMVWMAHMPATSERDPWLGHFERVCLELDLPANEIRGQIEQDRRAGRTRCGVREAA